MKVLTTVLLLALLLCAVAFLQSGSWLIVNQPQHSDVIVALGGLGNDFRYLHALALLRAGYGRFLIEDVPEGEIYGHRATDLAQQYVAQTAGPNAAQVRICPIPADSTAQETKYVAACISQADPNWHSGLLVTDDYHTRRSLATFRRRLPTHQWSVAATPNDYYFGVPWWKHREWAKTYIVECQKLLYWELWDRWKHS